MFDFNDALIKDILGRSLDQYEKIKALNESLKKTSSPNTLGHFSEIERQSKVNIGILDVIVKRIDSENKKYVKENGMP